jgi:hypothetical protein
MKNLPDIINEAFLMEKLGAAPKVSVVADFLKESVPTTWRRVKSGQFQALPGEGNIRISLKSLAAFLNAGGSYEPTYRRGKKPASAKPDSVEAIETPAAAQ